MDQILHHFETMDNHCFLAFTRGIITPAFLRWCLRGFRPSYPHPMHVTPIPPTPPILPSFFRPRNVHLRFRQSQPTKPVSWNGASTKPGKPPAFRFPQIGSRYFKGYPCLFFEGNQRKLPRLEGCPILRQTQLVVWMQVRQLPIVSLEPGVRIPRPIQT